MGISMKLNYPTRAWAYLHFVNLPTFRDIRMCDVVCFSSDLTVNIGSIHPEGRAPKIIDTAVAQQRGRCQSTPKTFPERSVHGLPCVNLENKNYGKQNRGTPL